MAVSLWRGAANQVLSRVPAERQVALSTSSSWARLRLRLTFSFKLRLRLRSFFLRCNIFCVAVFLRCIFFCVAVLLRLTFNFLSLGGSPFRSLLSTHLGGYHTCIKHTTVAHF